MELSSNFLKELIKLSLFKKDVVEIISEHVRFEYLPRGYKQVVKSLVTYFANNNQHIPTVGVLSQLNSADSQVQDILKQVNDTKLPDKEDILKQLETYIKNARFQVMYESSAELYNSDRQKEAIEFIAKESHDINNFSIYKGSSRFENIFSDFTVRQKSRTLKKMLGETAHEKIPYGIDQIDVLTDGGLDETETELFIARSGTGKTKYLRWRGVAAARRGYKVLHIQAEGSREKCLQGYDATWTAVLNKDLKNANISEELELKLERVIQDMKSKGGDIAVVAFEQFGTATMMDVRNLVLDYIKIHGKAPDLIIIDYLEKLNPGDGRKYPVSTEGEKMRREAVAEKMKNIAIEFKTRVLTATQANDISMNEWNNNVWYITRNNIAAAKGLVDAFSYIYTWNVTKDEYQNNVGRIYIDKFRDYRKPENIVKVATNFDYDRFYDKKRTLSLFFTE